MRKVVFEQAKTALSGLTQETFNALDTNGDGQLTPDELGFDAGTGCVGCQNTNSKSAGDGLAILFGFLGLAAMASVRR